MRVGILQPYFLPGLGYFDLIHLCDEWVVFDTAQYRRHSWLNRNRILHPTSGWQYVTAPVCRGPRERTIAEVELSEEPGWREGLLAKLEHYRKRAPHFVEVRALVERGLAEERRSLARLDVALLALVCERLEIPFRPRFFSEESLDLGPIEGPGDWALRISEALGASEYVNPPKGEPLFDREAFSRAGVRLRIRRFPDLVYATAGHEFVPGLSILDVLLWNAPEVVAAHLRAERSRFEAEDAS